MEAFEYATDLSERARLAGAVNALKFEGERIYADNFDGVGLVNDIQRNLGFSLEGRRVLLLGAGGAARGAVLPILEQSPATLVIANRTLQRAEALKMQFAGDDRIQVCRLQDLAEQKFDVVLNATSASLRGELPAVRADIFSPDGLAYELAYGKGLTPFLRLAKGAGVTQLADGVGMLVEQAAEAFEWWRGVRPDTKPMIEALTIPLV
ncbi:shikimate dehydrogenase [Marinobacterium aestuariivivens]|uniref:Shikimate dehydrogenase n=1 Tax=Marinobacterium aestuariivivens TaxID=1698799 RepID=A0ABW1ZZ64_9GAMM